MKVALLQRKRKNEGVSKGWLSSPYLPVEGGGLGGHFYLGDLIVGNVRVV